MQQSLCGPLVKKSIAEWHGVMVLICMNSKNSFKAKRRSMQNSW